MIRTLDWDSGHFGFPIARADAPPLAAADVAGAASEADRKSIRCLYLYSDAAATDVFRAAVSVGFEPIDVRIEMEKRVANAAGHAELAVEADRDRLTALARGVFGMSRFFRDPRFPRDRSEAMFARWIERGFEDPQRFNVVRREDGVVTAFCGCSVDGGVGRIELVGVAEEARGKGAGRSVVADAERELARRGCEETRVVTQGANIAALRIYEREGFTIRSCGLWFHRWAS